MTQRLDQRTYEAGRAGILVPQQRVALPRGLRRIKRHAMLGVRELMGAAGPSRLYAGFFVQAEDAARRMRGAMRDDDLEALRRSAHGIKGSASNLGLTALAAAAAALERDSATMAAPALALAVQRFEELTAATRALCRGEGLLS